jgi:Na+/H+ antiporter NhaD/arsenite permease-like protein
MAFMPLIAPHIWHRHDGKINLLLLGVVGAVTGEAAGDASTYIGNAPNFMLRAIAEHHGVAMPSFFGYMAWSSGILWPLFLLMTWIFFL